jgi:uncharacterized protein with FMN-binding domain
MKKIFLSFFVIVAFAIFATFSRQNNGIGIDKYFTPNTSIVDNGKSSGNIALNTNTQADPPVQPNPTQPASNPTPKTVKKVTTTSTPKPVGQYRDGTYTGSAADAFYGNIQVQAIIQGGRLADVVFLQYPNDRSRSININTQAMPYLKSEAISAQSANVNIISGASDSSMAFQESLGTALAQAIN